MHDSLGANLAQALKTGFMLKKNTKRGFRSTRALGRWQAITHSHTKLFLYANVHFGQRVYHRF